MSYNQHLINLQVTFTGLLASVFSGALGYFQVIVLDNINMYLAVVGVVFLDTLFGVINALNKGKYQKRKALKCVYYIMSYSVIITVVLMIEKAHPAAYYLSEATVLPILLFQFISALTNASLAKAIPQGLLLKILEKINAKDLITSNIQANAGEVKEAENQNNNPENIEG